MNEYRSYRVTLTTTQQMIYVVEARTIEQAEDAAEEMLADGEQPREIASTHTIIEDVEPIEELNSEEYSDGTGFHS